MCLFQLCTSPNYKKLVTYNIYIAEAPKFERYHIMASGMNGFIRLSDGAETPKLERYHIIASGMNGFIRLSDGFIRQNLPVITTSTTQAT